MYVNLMGIELEGAWKGERYVPPFDDTCIKHDGSVHFTRETNTSFIHYGEIVSTPLEYAELKDWAVKHIPTEVNTSCGTHIHVSMKKAGMYGCLLTPTFARSLMKQYTEYNENRIQHLDKATYKRFKERLEGRNRYCGKAFKGMEQISMTSKGGARYQQLNYCHRLRGTLEIRVLPATTNSVVLSELIDLTYNAINNWCAAEYRAEKVRFRRG